ncbi:hypothetical protein, partial [Xanthovirga aplysinae]|uniref:hypothetical protein n=1 Tax=Xanthovirga aplysinae TaxID=2529853 RepID=UPI0012BC2A90
MERSYEPIDESLILAYLKGEEISAPDRRYIEEWLKIPENRTHAREIYQAWELSLLSKTEKTDTQESFNKLIDKIAPKKVKERKRITPWWVAASIILALTTAYYFVAYRANPKSEIMELSTLEDKELFSLPDS